jgi:hypothetical protein
MIIYCNGDSFISGHDLGDDILPKFPGYYPASQKSKTSNNNSWYISTYNDRIRNSEVIEKTIKLEKERSFSGLLSSIYEYKVVNNAMPGVSIDRIARTTIKDLIQLKNNHKELIAIIGVTDIARTEVPGITSTWESIAPNFTSTNDVFDSLLRFKVEHEKNYHALVKFYKNAILIQDFCKINNIKLFWVHTIGEKISELQIESKYNLEEDLKNFKDYLNMEYILNMETLAIESKYHDVWCPGGHYSPTMHEIFANEINKIIRNNT